MFGLFTWKVLLLFALEFSFVNFSLGASAWALCFGVLLLMSFSLEGFAWELLLEASREILEADRIGALAAGGEGGRELAKPTCI